MILPLRLVVDIDSGFRWTATSDTPRPRINDVDRALLKTCDITLVHNFLVADRVLRIRGILTLFAQSTTWCQYGCSINADQSLGHFKFRSQQPGISWFDRAIQQGNCSWETGMTEVQVSCVEWTCKNPSNRPTAPNAALCDHEACRSGDFQKIHSPFRFSPAMREGRLL